MPPSPDLFGNIRFARVIVRACLLTSVFCALSHAQEADTGIAMPLTITGSGLYSHRAEEKSPGASSAAAAFRAVVYPSAKLGRHWYGYAALQIYSTPFFYEQAYFPERTIGGEVLQAFVGYSFVGEKKSFALKAGKLSSAFGSFPLRYDDFKNPLIDLPMSYGYYYKPVNVKGVTGFEIDTSFRRWDARAQLTNSSPADPQSLRSPDQHLQWTAGLGFTVIQGFRVGVSGYRGAYLDHSGTRGDWLIPGDRAQDYPAHGVGFDVQWARGRWSLGGEFQHFVMPYPRFPSANSNLGYGEAKVTINPRLYLAVRTGFLRMNLFVPREENYEVGMGYRLNRFQLLKVSYLWAPSNEPSWTHDNVLGIQFVTSIESLSKAIR